MTDWFLSQRVFSFRCSVLTLKTSFVPAEDIIVSETLQRDDVTSP